jgi:hypothetical protein
MENYRTSPPRRVLTPIILYLACGLTALILFVASLVSWLAEYLLCEACAALVVGLAFAMLSLVIYFIFARRSIEHLKEHIETIYDVAFTARAGYRRVVNFISSLLR